MLINFEVLGNGQFELLKKFGQNRINRMVIFPHGYVMRADCGQLLGGP